jgi:hypothetical protein
MSEHFLPWQGAAHEKGKARNATHPFAIAIHADNVYFIDVAGHHRLPRVAHRGHRLTPPAT